MNMVHTDGIGVFSVLHVQSVMYSYGVEACQHNYAGMKHCLLRLLLKSSRTDKE